MNERIKELQVLAKKIAYTELMEEGSDVYSANWSSEWNERFGEKFAELIVRECAVIVKDCDIIKEVDDGEHPAFEAGYLLKKHFGVE